MDRRPVIECLAARVAAQARAFLGSSNLQFAICNIPIRRADGSKHRTNIPARHRLHVVPQRNSLYIHRRVWNLSRVRFLIFLGFICLFAALTRAQEPDTERKLFDRVLYRNLKTTHDFQGQSFYGGKGYTESRKANTKAFYSGVGQVATKQAVSRTFYDSKNFWGGKAQLSTADANTRTGHSIPFLSRIFSSKKAETKKDYDAGKQYDIGSGVVRTREYRGPETKDVERTFPNASKHMTIDQVRELLNRR
jgi:hypothetical protein